MSLDLLDAPLRVTWNLAGGKQPTAGGIALRVADALAEAGVFFVQLDGAPLSRPDLPDLLGRLERGGCRAGVVCGVLPSERESLKDDLFLPEILIDSGAFLGPAGLDGPSLAEVLAAARERAGEVALLLLPTGKNIKYFQTVVAFCRDHGVGRFKLPNMPIDASLSTSPELLQPADVSVFRKQVANDLLDLGSDLRLEVHDLFLWEVLFPGGGGERSEYGGCQAGNSVGHVDAAGDLYPCSSWPERLGSLLESGLPDLWASPRRLDVRRRIAETAVGCRGCRDLPICFGGCRGLALAGCGEQGRDPACSGPR